MSFFDIFRPKWENSNKDIRRLAVEKLDDAFLLAGIAENDSDSDVRETAKQKLKNPALARKLFEAGIAAKDEATVIKHLTSAIEAGGLTWQQEAKALTIRATCYLAKANLSRAREDYNSAVSAVECEKSSEIAGIAASAYWGRGNLKMAERNYSLAISDYDEAIRRKPDFAAAYHQRGKAYVNSRQPRQALPDFEMAARLDPQDHVAAAMARTIRIES